MLMNFNRSFSTKLITAISISAVSVSCAARYVPDAVSANRMSDCVLSSDSIVRRVQLSPDFELAANRIARWTYARMPEYQLAEVVRICSSLKVFARIEALEIVYGEAYHVGHLVPVYFGVDTARVQTLNPVVDGRIWGGLSKDAWNGFVLRKRKITIRSETDAASIGCLLHTLQTDRFPFDGCEVYEPVEVRRVGTDWVVGLNEGTVRFTVRGEVR